MFIIYVILFSLQFGPYLPTEYWVRDIYIVKQHILQQIRGQKIVIVSGSNGLYGIDSSMIQEATGVKTVNMSIHAGLSLDFILDPWQLGLKPGDIVILPLEFEFFNQQVSYNNLTIEAVLSWNRGFFDRLSPGKKIEFITSCSPLRVAASIIQKYIRREVRHLLSPAKITRMAEANWSGKKQGIPGTLYQNINAYGDIIKNQGTGDIKIIETGYGCMVVRGWEVPASSRKSLGSFARYCHKNKIKVFFTWACTLKSRRFNLENPVIQENLAKIKGYLASIDILVLGEASDFHFERKYFFDTNYHLNDEGRTIRTKRIIGFLKPYLLLLTGFP